MLTRVAWAEHPLAPQTFGISPERHGTWGATQRYHINIMTRRDNVNVYLEHASAEAEHPYLVCTIIYYARILVRPVRAVARSTTVAKRSPGRLHVWADAPLSADPDVVAMRGSAGGTARWMVWGGVSGKWVQEGLGLRLASHAHARCPHLGNSDPHFLVFQPKSTHYARSESGGQPRQRRWRAAGRPHTQNWAAAA